MIRHFSMLGICLGVLFSISGFGQQVSKEQRQAAHQLVKQFNNQIWFEPNIGHLPKEVLYRGEAHGRTVQLLQNGLSYGLKKDNQRVVWNMKFHGNGATGYSGHEAFATAFSRFVENKQVRYSKYGEVWYENAFPNTDMRVYNSTKSEVKYDLIVHPGGDPSNIQFDLEGVSQLAVNNKGELLFTTALGEMKDSRPYTYQIINGKEIEVSSEFMIIDENSFGFKITETYDLTQPLIIDPTNMDWASFMTGSDAQSDYLYDIIIDNDGNLYATGFTLASDFPTQSGSYDQTHGGAKDAFVFKLSSDGTDLLWSTYLGQANDQTGHAITVDVDNNVYVAGEAIAGAMPTTSGVVFETAIGNDDGFVTKFDEDGGLVWSTLFGGTSKDIVKDVQVFNNKVYITGYTTSNDLPTHTGAFSETYAGSKNGFIARLDIDATTVEKCTYSGNTNFASDEYNRLEVVNDGVFVVGINAFGGLATLNPIQAANGGVFDATVQQFDLDLENILFGTYLGGSGSEDANDIKVQDGALYMTGWSSSSTFMGESKASTGQDAFAVKINYGTPSLEYVSIIGGTGLESGQGIAVTPDGEALVLGVTQSTDFPTVDPFQAALAGGIDDLFLTHISADGNSFISSTYLGGSAGEHPFPHQAGDGRAAVHYIAGKVYFGAATHSVDFPVTPGAYQDTKLNAGNDASVVSCMPINGPCNTSWSAPDCFFGDIGIIDLNEYLDPGATAGGLWMGDGVSNGMFDPTGLSGDIIITYTFGTCATSDTIGLGGSSGPSGPSVPFPGCDVCTYTYPGSGTNISLATGQTLCVLSGDMTGNINGNAKGTVCIAEGATFRRSSWNTTSDVINGGTFISTSNFPVANTTNLSNWGVFEVNALNFNGTGGLNNYAGGEFTIGGALNIGNGVDVFNEGELEIGGNFRNSGTSTVVNEGYIQVTGTFTPDADFANNGFVNATSTINLNASGDLQNNCGFTTQQDVISNGSMSNNGLILMLNNGSWTHQNGTFTTGPESAISGNGFQNNHTVVGSGKFYFTGTTSTQGTFGTASDTMNFYDEGIPSNGFDTRNGSVGGLVTFDPFPKPTEADFPTGCSQIITGTENKPPALNPDICNVVPDTFAVVVNCHDSVEFCVDAFEPDGELIHLELASAPSNGTLSNLPTVDDDTCLYYFPNAGYSGSDQFAIQVCDESGGCDTAVVNVTVNPTPQPSLDLDANNNSGATGNDYERNWTEASGSNVRVADTDVNLTDPTFSFIDSVTVNFTNLVDAGESIIVSGANITTAAGLGIEVDIVSASEIILRNTSGTATLDNFETVIEMIRYRHTSQDPTGGDRTIEYVAYNRGCNPASDVATTTITVVPENDCPVTDINTGTAGFNHAIAYTEGDGTVFITSTVAITDVDNTTLASITIDLDNRQDAISFESLGIQGSLPSGISATTNTADQIVLEGPASLADFETALGQITWENTSDDLTGTPARTITITVDDGSGDVCQQAITTITVTPENDCPTIDLNTGSSGSGNFVNYSEGDGAVNIVALYEIEDVDDANLESMTITLNDRQNGAAETIDLSGALTGGITIGSQTATQIVLNGPATLASFENALLLLVYENTSSAIIETPDRTVDVTINDGDCDVTAVATISLKASNDCPILNYTASSAMGDYTEGDGAVAIVNSVSISDADNANLTSMTISVTNVDGALEGLSINGTLPNDITASTNNNEEIVLSGPAALADFETALGQIRWSHTGENPTDGNRTVSISISDGDPLCNVNDNGTVTLTSVNDCPEIDLDNGSAGIDFNTTFTEGGSPISIIGAINITDLDHSNLQSVRVELLNRADAMADEGIEIDELSLPNGITANTGTQDIIVLSGLASLADYEAALGLITYSHTSDDPSETPIREIEITVNDGDASCSSVASTFVEIEAINDCPDLDLNTDLAGNNYETTFTEGGGAIAITGSVSISDLDNTTLASVTVELTNRVDAISVEGISVNLGGLVGGITADVSSQDVIVLEGPAALTDFISSLAAITYDHTSEDPSFESDRILTITLDDGDASCDISATTTITINPVNDCPEIDLDGDSGNPGIQLAFTEDQGSIAIINNPSLTDVDSDSLQSITITLLNDQDGVEGVIHSGVTAGDITVTGSGSDMITIAGPALTSDFLAALNGLAYFNNSDDPDTTVVREILVTVDDGDIACLVQDTAFVTITPLNDCPEIYTNGNSSYSAEFIEDEGGVAIVGNLKIVDPDDDQLDSVMVVFTNNQGDVTEGISLSGAFSSITIDVSRPDTIILVGPADTSDFRTALQAIVYENTSNNPSLIAREFAIIISDGDMACEAADTTVIQVTPVNDCPQVDLDATELGFDFVTEFTEGSGGQGVALDGSVLVVDPDDVQLDSVIVVLTNNADGTDEGIYLDGSNVPAGITLDDSRADTLILYGAASFLDYQTAIDSIYYNNVSLNPVVSGRTVTVVAYDGDCFGDTSYSSITFAGVNDCPVLTVDADGSTGASSGDAAITYNENDGKVNVTDSDVLISDPDDVNMDTLMVVLTNNVQGGAEEGIHLDPSMIAAGITVDSTKMDTLLLYGPAARADFASTVANIYYLNTSEDPDDTPRVISFVVSDGECTSSMVMSTIAVVKENDCPVVDLDGNTVGDGFEIELNENNGPVNLVGNIAITDVDDSQLDRVLVILTNRFDAEESLDTANVPASLSTVISGDTVYFNGPADISDYLTALQNITYNHTGDDPSTEEARTILIEISDGDNSCDNEFTSVVTIIEENDCPEIEIVSALPIDFIEGEVAQNVFADVVISDLDNSTLSRAEIVLIGRQDEEEGISIAGAFGGIGIDDSSKVDTIILSGTQTIAQYEAAIEAIVYQHTGDDPTVSPDRQVVVSITDGDVACQVSTTADVSITALNDCPVIDSDAGDGSVIMYTEGDGPRLLAENISIIDLDNDSLESVTVSLTNAVDLEESISLTGGFGDVNVNLVSSSEIQLTGPALIADFVAAIESIQYEHAGEDPTDIPARVVDIVINDGECEDSAVATIELTKENDCPEFTLTSNSVVNYEEGQGVINITSAVQLTDVDNSNLVTVLVVLDGRLDDEEGLNLTAFDPSIQPIITQDSIVLIGPARIEAFIEALETITYEHLAQNPTEGTRTITAFVDDGDGSCIQSDDMTINISSENDCPVIEMTTRSFDFVEQGGAISIFSDITISDLDHSTLSSVSVEITNPQDNEESLALTASGSVVVDQVSNTELNLTGGASISEYVSVLQTLMYEHTSANPTLSPNRIVTITINDGECEDSENLLVRIDGIDDCPVLDMNGSGEGVDLDTLFYLRSEGTSFGPNVTITDVDDSELKAATIILTNPIDTTHEGVNMTEAAIAFAESNGVEVERLGTDTLYLKGPAVIDSFELIIGSVYYYNELRVAEHETDRKITIVLHGENPQCAGDTVWVTVDMIKVNDAPIAVNDVDSTCQGYEITIPVTLNDIEPDADAGGFLVSIDIVDEPMYGMVEVDDLSIIYTPDLDFFGDDQFSYVVYDDFGDSDTAEVLVNVCERPVKTYKGISPDGDGKNDVFEVDNIDLYPDNVVRIYNRWGNLVWEAQGYDNEEIVWAGESNVGMTVGEELPDGTYFYVVDLGSGKDPIQNFVILTR